jgi:hypothetical protein
MWSWAEMTEQFKKKKELLGLIYGLVAGITFSMAAWGVDGVYLAQSHVAYPWIKFLVGLLISSLVGSFIGWLSIKISNGLITIVLWLLYGLMLVGLIIWLPFQISPFFIKILKPMLIDWIDYPLVDKVNQFKVIGIIVIALPVFLGGLLENNLIESVMMSSHRGAILVLILVCGFFMALAGFAGDELTNKHFREPIQALDELFQFALDNQGKELDKVLIRRKHLKTVEGMEDILPRSRQLTLIAFDEYLAQMDILVNFEGVWVKCTTIYSQPIMCEQISKSPIIFISSLSLITNP